jgi:hypothetical protein
MTIATGSQFRFENLVNAVTDGAEQWSVVAQWRCSMAAILSVAVNLLKNELTA